ncbi:hypothetical protein [Streptomyces sp. NPDC002644]
MIKVKQSTERHFFAAGKDIADARRRADEGYEGDSPREAWNELGYWEREDEADKYEVFEFTVIETAEKVDPPYSR